MTDPNQFDAVPEENPAPAQPEQSAPQTPEYGQYVQPAAGEQPTQPINTAPQTSDGSTMPTTPIYTQPAAQQTPTYTPAPEYGAYAPATPAQQPAPTPEYGQYAQQAPQQATPQYGQYAGQTPTGSPYAQPQGAPYANQYQGQYDNPYGQAPQYGAPLPQGVPGYIPGDQSIGIVPLDQPDYRCTFGNAIKRFFKKYAVFSGRASRREFWWVILFFVLCNIAIGFVGGMFMLVSAVIPTVLSVLWTLATIVPYVAVAVRRLHDSNKSGWWVLLPGIPYVISEIINYTVIVPASDQLTNTLMSAASGLDEDAAAQMFVNQLGAMAGPSALSSICSLIFLISGLVLMCAAPNPAGVRFDAAQSGSQMPQTPPTGYQQPTGYNAGGQMGNNPYSSQNQ